MILTQDNVSIQKKIKNAKLYCITMPQNSIEAYKRSVEGACRGGADVIQLRDKNLSARDLLALAKELKEICHRFGSLFILNDRIDLALLAGADGVHLGQDDLPLPEARKVVESFRFSFEGQLDFLIGRSTHSLEQAIAAQQEGADYLGCGPVFATPTKPTYGAVGLELVQQYKKNIRIPFVAIGGIDLSNVSEVKKAGAHCVAVVRAAFGSEPESVEVSVRSLKAKL